MSHKHASTYADESGYNAIAYVCSGGGIPVYTLMIKQIRLIECHDDSTVNNNAREISLNFTTWRLPHSSAQSHNHNTFQA